MAEEITHIHYQEKYSQIHREFVERSPWKGSKRRWNPSYLRWKYRAGNAEEFRNFYISLAGNQVVAQMAAIPALLHIDGKEQEITWACNQYLEPAYRGKGTGIALYQLLVDDGRPVLGNEPSPKSLKSAKAGGFESIQGPRRFDLMLEPSHMVKIGFAKFPPFVRQIVSLVFKPYAALMQWRINRMGKTGVQAIPMEQLAQRIAIARKKIGMPHIVHDVDFLSWRMNPPEGFLPPLFAVGYGEEAYAVFGPAGDYFYLYDWYAGSRDELFALVKYILHQANQAKGKTIQAYANGTKQEMLLASVGFRGRKSRNLILYRPNQVTFGLHKRLYFAVYDSDGNL